MWSNVSSNFDKYPAQQKVAQMMMELGLSVRNGIPYCANIRLSLSAIADACGTDRRIVTATIETIEANKFLKDIFDNLQPTCSFKNIAPIMKWGVLEIVPDDVNQPGIISEVSGIIAKEGISIRQFIADDPDVHADPRAFIVTNTQIPGRLLQKIKSVKGVSAVVIY